MRKEKIIAIADKDRAKLNYYQFWLWQYLKRNQTYRKAYQYIEQLSLSGDLGSWTPRKYKKAERLVLQFGFLSPNYDYPPGHAWLRDETTGTAFLPGDDGLTADRILKTLLEVRRVQGCTERKKENVSFIIPQCSAFRVGVKPVLPKIPDDLKGYYIYTKENHRLKMDFDVDKYTENLNRLLKNTQSIQMHEPPGTYAFADVAAGKRVTCNNVPRAVGLWLWDKLQTVNKKTGAKYRKVEAIDDYFDAHRIDKRLPLSYRLSERESHLYDCLKHTDNCILKLKVLSI